MGVGVDTFGGAVTKEAWIVDGGVSAICFHYGTLRAVKVLVLVPVPCCLYLFMLSNGDHCRWGSMANS